MAGWCLEAYDTELRQARSREYTTSARTAELWERIPRIDFTDSGHGIVFHALPHSGKRKPTTPMMEHAREHLARAEEGALMEGKYGRLFTCCAVSHPCRCAWNSSISTSFSGGGAWFSGSDFLATFVTEPPPHCEPLTFPADEPLFLLRGQDKIAPSIIEAYAGGCQIHRAPPGHVSAVIDAHAAFIDWQIEHPDRTKVPD